MVVPGNHSLKVEKPHQKWEMWGRNVLDRLQKEGLEKQKPQRFQYLEPSFPVVSLFKKFFCPFYEEIPSG